MGDITSASAEQRSGIESVNSVIAQMDEATQQNSALVEQAAAASQSLQEQAASLFQAVAVFEVAADKGTRHPSDRNKNAANAPATNRAVRPRLVARTA
jgi:methyl-accepting chemotaxis protein